MSKELVISSNHHETRVAILEDDQLVEIYFQRAQEYSLAGSIHKGRVTRVLPGMQSAFVDLGLERDTFLYVSDFFEENGEEYDRIAPEDRGGAVRKDSNRQESRFQASVPAVAPAPVAPQQPDEPFEAAEEPLSDVGAEATAAPEPRSGEESDGRDRRGRRSRRRRSRGRGFPESKYASDIPRETREAPADGADESVGDTSELILLPGESLAKYTSRATTTIAENAEPDVDAGEDLEGLDTADAVDEIEAGAAVEELTSGPDPEAEPAGLSAAGTSAELLDFEVSSSDARDILDDDEENEPEIVVDVVDEIEEQVDEAESRLLAGDLAASESADQSTGDADDDIGGDVPSAPELSEALAPEGEPVNSPAEESPSQSLTASVREGGGRYPHRQSRRMRRKRGGERSDRGSERIPERPEAQSAADFGARSTATPEKDRSERPATPSITDLLREGQEIIVQIAKEPLGQKGARITSHIALPGRFVVYMPTLEHLGVSRKISTEEERQRLKRVLQASRTGLTGGFIVRTAGEGRSEEEIAADMAYLYNLWLDIRQKAEKRKAPALLHHDLDIVHRILRDQLSDMFKAVWTDNEEVYESILRFMQRFQPALVGRVKMYTRQAPIFDAFGVAGEIEKALKPKVWLKSGGYIVINQTEALVAIDVNTGKFVGKSNRLEDTITKINTEAVKEIVRQIRLRDLGGIIVIDFIDMDERKNRQKVMQVLEETMRADRAPYKILQFNDFGLVAITRKRVKQSLERTLCAPCPTCEAAGYVKSVATVVGEILQEAAKVRSVVDGKNVELRVYPEVAKHLKSNTNSDLEEVESILGCSVLVISDSSLHPEKFDMAW